MTNKPWLCFLAGPNSLKDIKDMHEPIKDFFKGLCVTYHGDREDAEALYLESNKGEGRIIYVPYVGRHDHSRNCYLYNGIIEQGDWCFQTDVLEHPSSTFLMGLPFFLKHWTEKGANAVFFHGKPLVFKFHESMRYMGTPHEALQRQDGQMRAVEISDSYPNEADVRLNVRPQRRQNDHWVKHYARYSLLCWGSNHYMLGLENKPNARELFMERELGRLKFIELLKEIGVERDVDSIIGYMRTGDMDERVVQHIEKDKIWNDVYKYHVLGKNVTDNHDWNDLIKVNE